MKTISTPHDTVIWLSDTETDALFDVLRAAGVAGWNLGHIEDLQRMLEGRDRRQWWASDSNEGLR